MATTRVILYARLSVTTDESVSITEQLRSGRLYCQSRGWEVVGEYVDDGVSASAKRPEDRAGWHAVLAHPKGTYELVLVKKVDRLARKVLDFLHAHHALEERGAAIAAVDDPVDMSTAQGRAFATMLAVFAEMEAESIRARVKAARVGLVKAGRVPGGAAPFGYQNAPNPNGPGKVLAKDPQKISHVAESAARILRGDSVGSVATYLDDVAPLTGRSNSASAWTTTVTKRMLSNPVLAGMTLYNPGNTTKERGNDVLRDADGMPIVRDDLAVVSVQEYRTMLDRMNKPQPVRAASESFLSGIVWCGHCDRKMYRNARTVAGKRVRVFQCQTKQGCGQQVTGLENIVEERFLREFGHLAFSVHVSVPSDYDLSEVNNQISLTLDQMQDDGADVMALAQRLKTLRETRARVPEVEYKTVFSDGTSGQQWEKDPREALLFRFAGVRLVKGKTGRKFDQSRLSWIERDGEVIDSEGMTDAEFYDALFPEKP